MHYLKCIALLNYLLRRLHAGQRDQVPVSVVQEVTTTLLGVNKQLADDITSEPMLGVQLEDLLASLGEIRNQTGLSCLTETMKLALVDGITTLQGDICMRAYNYFIINDFEPTEQTIPVMRIVVKTALERGAI